MWKGTAFYLSGKVVGLLLVNSAAKAYLYNQGGMVSLFLSGTACCILNLATKHGITLIPAYIPTHFNVEANFLYAVFIWAGPFVDNVLYLFKNPISP